MPNSSFGGYSAQPAPANVPYLNVQDQKAQNTSGGSLTGSTWNTRTLNTVQADTAGLVTAGLVKLASNQLTLPPGTWQARASATAFTVSFHQTRLQNITSATTIITGTSEAAAGSQVTSRSHLSGVFVLSNTSVIELQHNVNTTNATNGGGAAANFGTEVYAIVELWKLA